LLRGAMMSLDRYEILRAAPPDPPRRSSVRPLGAAGRAGMICACDFVECCDVSQPTISHHLKVLREAGVVTSERHGTNIYYALSPDAAVRYAAIGTSLAGLVPLETLPSPA
jgi:DNA-binding transcriptional ArsR family regulator